MNKPDLNKLSKEVFEAHKALDRAKENNLNKISLRINRMTTIFIRPDQDPIKAKARFLKRKE